MNTQVFARLMAVCLLFVSSTTAFAADVWMYEWREARSFQQAPFKATDDFKHWVVTEFKDDPYAGELQALQRPGDVQKISVLFHRSAAGFLAQEYLDLARAWRAQGIHGQFKFVGTYPTQSEADELLPLCDEGLQLIFIGNVLPGPDEARNLVRLGKCAEVTFAMGRYFKYDEIKLVKWLEGVKLSVVASYFPAYANADVLNLIGLPIAVRVTDAGPTAAHITLLNGIKKLTNLTWEVSAIYDPKVYDLVSKLDRGPGRELGLRWAWSTPREADLDAWARLRPWRAQVPKEAWENAALRARLEKLDGEVIVETFVLAPATLLQ